MIKNQPSEREFCAAQNKLSQVAEHSQNPIQVQITQDHFEQADSSVSLEIKNGSDVDAPINLVKGKRCNRSSPELTEGSLANYQGCGFAGTLSHSMHVNISEGGVEDFPIHPVQNNVTDSEPSKTADVHITTEMKQVRDDESQMKCPKLAEAKFQSDYNLIHQRVSLSNGGMLARQLVSPLRSNLNSWSSAESNNNRENSLYLSPICPKVSSITVPSLLPSAANIPSTSQSRSHITRDTSSSNQSPCSASTVDLTTATRVVISAAIRNASAVLEEEERPNPASNVIVISDQQTRNIETAGKFSPASDLLNLLWRD